MSNAKRMKIMKKLFYSVLALAGILAVSCNKEIDKQQVAAVDTESVSTHTVTIRADFGADTRTAYANDKTFSWVEGDVIYVYTVNETTSYARFAELTAQNSGATADFVGEVEDGYEPYGLAFYAHSEWVTWDEDDFYIYLPGTTAIDDDQYSYHVDSSNPMANVPLSGVIGDDDVFHFMTATGVLKFNLTDLPEDAKYFEVEADDGNMLQGLFAVDLETGQMNRDGAVINWTYLDDQGEEQTERVSYTNLFYKFEPDADGKATIYVPVPVGTLGAGATIRIYNEAEEVVFSKSTTKDIPITRNKITELVPLSCKVVWVSLGNGLFGDHFHFNDGYEQSVEIQMNEADPTQFRLVDPYAGYRTLMEYEPTGNEYGPGPYLNFRIIKNGESINGVTATHDDLVYFDSYYTGIVNSSYGVDPFLAHPSRWADPESYWLRSIVVKYQADGVTPANVQLAPYFFWLTDPDAGRGYINEEYVNENNVIEICFPGADRIDLQAAAEFVEITNDDPTQAIALVDVVLGDGIASADVVIAADQSAAVAALADASRITKVTATGECSVKLPANAPSGNYFIYLQTTPAEGLTPAAAQLLVSPKFYYNNKNDDLGLDVTDLYGTWTGAIWRKPPSEDYYQEDFTITFAESDDPFLGDVLLTEVYGWDATINAYGYFDGKTGVLTIAGGQPWTVVKASGAPYAVGMVDAQAPNKDLVFRYREDNSLYLESCEFVAFYLYDPESYEETDYWLGYFYGDTSDYHLTLTKTADSSAPARSIRRANLVESAPVEKAGHAPKSAMMVK